MIFCFPKNISTFAMCDLRYYDYGARLKRTQKELLNLNNYLFNPGNVMENDSENKAFVCKRIRLQSQPFFSYLGIVGRNVYKCYTGDG